MVYSAPKGIHTRVYPHSIASFRECPPSGGWGMYLHSTRRLYHASNVASHGSRYNPAATRLPSPTEVRRASAPYVSSIGTGDRGNCVDHGDIRGISLRCGKQLAMRPSAGCYRQTTFVISHNLAVFRPHLKLLFCTPSPPEIGQYGITKFATLLLNEQP